MPKYTTTLETEVKNVIQFSLERQERWHSLMYFHSDLVEAFEAIEWEPYYFSTLQFRKAGTGEDLTAAFRILRTHGWILQSDRPEANASEWAGDFTHPGFSLRINLYFSSTVCQRVQVGTEMKEVPVYEIRCGEAPPAPPPSDDIPF